MVALGEYCAFEKGSAARQAVVKHDARNRRNNGSISKPNKDVNHEHLEAEPAWVEQVAPSGAISV
jgi:hypothetical protein